MNILNHRQDLNKLGISLHSRIVGLLVGQIEEAIADGRIRSEDGKHSIFDFIEVFLDKKNPRQVFSELQNADHVVRKMDNMKFIRSDGRLNRESPATDLVGLLYIGYTANSEFSVTLRSASAAHFASDRQIPIIELPPKPIAPIVFEQLAPIAKQEFPRLVGKTQTEICQLASDYLQIREVATEQMPTLIDILDHLADPTNLEEVRCWFTARQWVTQNRRKMTPRQQRHFFRAIADCHRFLTISQPQKRDGVNYYNNRHELLLTACADNTIKLVRPTVPFI
jgi:hypothetical protein